MADVNMVSSRPALQARDEILTARDEVLPIAANSPHVSVSDVEPVDPVHGLVWADTSPDDGTLRLKVFHEGEWKSCPAKSYEEYTYAWLGEPHASASVRLDDDGNEVARNLAHNPRGAGTSGTVVVVPDYEGTESPDPDFDLVDGNLVAPAPRSGTMSNGVLYYSRTRNVLALRRREEDADAGNMFVNNLGHTFVEDEPVAIAVEVWSETNQDEFTMRTYINSGTPTGNYRTITGGHGVIVETGTSNATWVVANFTASYLSPGDTFYFRHHKAIGNTEEAALSQVEHLFDGSTPSDRAWVDFQPRNISGIKRIWPRSVTPPPAGTHYAWLGEPHASASVRLDDDGNEVARNWLRHPSFELGTTGVRSSSGKFDLRESQYPPRLFSGETALRVLRTEEEPYEYDYVGQRIYDPLPAGWVAFKVHDFQAVTSDIGALRLRVDFRIGGRNVANLGPVTPVSITSHIPGRDQFTHVVEVPEGVEWADVYLYTFADMNRTPPPTTSQYTTDAWQVVTADTEESALAQVEHYFDGSTPSDRANDLWYNTDGVPHEWVNGQGWTPTH